ncbi:hypothetical protein HHI36_010412 [Cryptolaemus montrouzieri]|uniref:Plancitoxin-1 n=1 Tax=Cryptolaemus montrouzieri TaxID=559131 RepID=A0ABD2MJE3_9CUCU
MVNLIFNQLNGLQLLIFILFLIDFNKNVLTALQCVDENNYPVDWYIAYKLPVINKENGLTEFGLSYIYVTSHNYSSWITSDIPINATNSLIGNTLSKFYDHKNDISIILYNDETPYGQVSSDKGHTKGVVLTNSNGGLWLIHSVPKFPHPDFFDYPETGLKYGQSILCISLDIKNMDIVGIQLQYNQPYIYYQNMQSSLEGLVPNLFAAANNKTIKTAPWYHQVLLNSLQGTNFISFAKSKNFGKDLYEDWVAPALQSSLLVETWPDGPGRLSSDCTKKFKVQNVETISMVQTNVTFNTTHDHSKWAVSFPEDDTFWICVGDINRAESQEKRGGGTVCLKNEHVSANFQNVINAVEDCANEEFKYYVS